MNTLQGPITAIHPQCAVEAAMPRFTALCKSGDKNAPIVGKRGCQTWYRRSTAWNTQEKQYRRLGGGGCCGARPRRLEHVRIHLSFAVPLPVGERQGEARQEQAGQQMRAVRRSQWPQGLVLGIYPTPHMHRYPARRSDFSTTVFPQGPSKSMKLVRGSGISVVRRQSACTTRSPLERPPPDLAETNSTAVAPFERRHDGEDYGEFPAVRSCVWCSTAR